MLCSTGLLPRGEERHAAGPESEGDHKEILVQLGYSVFNLRMVEGQNRVQGRKNRYKEIKIQIDQTPVLVSDFEDTVVMKII